MVRDGAAGEGPRALQRQLRGVRAVRQAGLRRVHRDRVDLHRHAPPAGPGTVGRLHVVEVGQAIARPEAVNGRTTQGRAGRIVAAPQDAAMMGPRAARPTDIMSLCAAPVGRRRGARSMHASGFVCRECGSRRMLKAIAWTPAERAERAGGPLMCKWLSSVSLPCAVSTCGSHRTMMSFRLPGRSRSDTEAQRTCRGWIDAPARPSRRPHRPRPHGRPIVMLP